MKKPAWVLSLIVKVMALMGVTAMVYALDDVSNMRCNGTIVEIGDQQFEFQEKCGSPTVTEENGQVWVYDLRPEGFVYYVSFSDGKVERIQVGGND